jgi:hypothetical protein
MFRSQIQFKSCRNCEGENCFRCANRATSMQQVFGAPRAPLLHLKGDLKRTTALATPFAYGDITHKKPARGKRKKRNMVTLKAKGYCAEKKSAKLKLISTPVGTGVQSKIVFNVGEKVVVYGGEEILTNHNLGTPWGQKLAGIADAPYVMKAQTKDGKVRWFDGGSAWEAKKGRYGAFVNDPRGRVFEDGTPMEANIIFCEDSNDLPAGYAIKQINVGDELLADYGWDDATWDANLRRDAEKKTKKQ